MMLQRAASNAYSWWWASHIRTKQSKWLEQNLQDMEEKVKYIVKLIEEDGDSFAKRAEMYYRKRPELIKFVEESYRAYRALAERYDHISGELQNANNTIATVFPEQVQFAMDEEDEDEYLKISNSSLNPTKLPMDLPEAPKPNIPKVPMIPKKEQNSPPTLLAKKSQPKKTTASTTITSSPRMSKAEALEEVDRLQKGILALQTEKEFFKSSYERSHTKYWEIEKQITEMQEEICSLQDEFNIGTVIEDDEARTLMAATALKSCQETLIQLQEKQERSAEEAKIECQRVKDAHEKLKTLRCEFLGDQIDQKILSDEKESISLNPNLNLAQEEISLKQDRLELGSICNKIMDHFEVKPGTSLTMSELVEKIDELANKVINLEVAVSCQTALIMRLKSETDELQAHLRTLEEDKSTLIKGSNNLIDRLRELDSQLQGIRDLNRNVEDQNNNLKKHFTELHCDLNHLSKKLQSVKPDEEVEMASSFKEVGTFPNDQSTKSLEEQEKVVTPAHGLINLGNRMEVEEMKDEVQNSSHQDEDVVQPNLITITSDISEKHSDEKEQGKVEKQDPSQTENIVVNVESQEGDIRHDDQPNCQQLKRVIEQSVKPDEEVEMTSSFKEVGTFPNDQSTKSLEEQEKVVIPAHGLVNLQNRMEVEEKKDGVQNSSYQDEYVVQPKLNTITSDILEKHSDEKEQGKVEKKDPSQAEDIVVDVKSQEGSIQHDVQPNWQQLFLNGLEDREKILLTEYTSILQNYKELKKKLSEVEKKNRDSQFETMVQLRELKTANAMKDEEIKSLHQKLSFLQTSSDKNSNIDPNDFDDSKLEMPHDAMTGGATSQFTNIPTVTPDHQPTIGRSIATKTAKIQTTQDEEDDDDDEIKVIFVNEPHTVSAIEEKFRMDVDKLLEENLEFWLRFSTSFHKIQKFQTIIQDLQAEFSKLKENKRKEGNTERSLKSDARPIYKHLREIQTELTVWLEQNALLKDELQYRFSSLCNMQEEISRVSKACSEAEEVEFTSYQAAKFQGEVLNMQQENNKVAEELQAGLDHVRGLRFEIEKTLSKLNEEFDLSGSKNHHSHIKHTTSRPRVPLRSFIFGDKPKKQKPSIFSCMNPALRKQHSNLRTGLPI
ncbi:PREDICTED: kinase-interacting protein 1-like [Nelumbo nucifera]|uniref:Kinase-interacting protein 1-like n=2 Tax=Nelumbo nucifera TaxID=4432 RepID=A0A1U8B8S4_NELNU|nr:PREDICTED: kinase-interacting protein 1-like [Nelumbo nucifera]DAD22122.1 TPA_asm: hypothetical protein HUJ06_023585 [Nelumbo nucifera]